MARLEHVNTGRLLTLAPRTLVGRAPETDLRLRASHVSGQHARISWSSRSGWRMRDLGSRNGTWLDGARVAVGEDHALEPGTVVSFGADAPEWRVIDVQPPCAFAAAADGGTVRQVTHGFITLPDDHARAFAYEGERGQWLLEMGGDVRTLSDREVVEVDGVEWTFHLPLELPSTVTNGTAQRDVALHFQVSRDEEHVGLTAVIAGREVTLKPRAHLYTLLTLARQRLRDRQEGIADSEEGWVHREDLQRWVALDANVVHTHLFRARRQLSKAGLPPSAAIIERRPDAGTLRIGISAVEVIELGQG